LVDTHPGLNEETLLSIAISDVLLVILRPDQQDYQGTAVTIDVARQLDVPRMYLAVNKVPARLPVETVRSKVEETYRCPVAGVIPHSEDMLALASEGIFVRRYPEHEVSRAYRNIVRTLMGDGTS
jgi:MinD-like ATPase involved in chromosome partitioning or flagellar assembly